MKPLFYFLALILFFASCSNEGDDPAVAPITFHMKPHNSNNEFYADVPVEFYVKSKPNPWQPTFMDHAGMEVYVDGSKIENGTLPVMVSAGTYEIRALVTMFDDKTYQFDTTLNIVSGPPVFVTPRQEEVLFGWRSGTNYKVLLKGYNGSSVYDYDVITINEALQQHGDLKRMDFGWYPDMYDYGVSPSGELVLVYDNSVNIFDAGENLKHQIFYSNGRTPRKILVKENEAVLLFDSLSHVSLKKADLSTGQLTKGPSRFMGVEGLTLHDYFFLNQSEIAAYYVEPGNAKTMLLGVDLSGNIGFTQYFLPPAYIKNVIPLSGGGYVVASYISAENDLTVFGADETHVVKWRRTFKMNFRNFWYQIPGNRVAVKELAGFTYVFFDNMRCIKLSAQGQVIWDKYFYSEIARFDDVLITPDDKFIMAGTRRRYVGNIQGEYQTDVLMIKIDTDGFRVAD